MRATSLDPALKENTDGYGLEPQPKINDHPLIGVISFHVLAHKRTG